MGKIFNGNPREKIYNENSVYFLWTGHHDEHYRVSNGKTQSHAFKRLYTSKEDIIYQQIRVQTKHNVMKTQNSNTTEIQKKKLVLEEIRNTVLVSLSFLPSTENPRPIKNHPENTRTQVHWSFSGHLPFLHEIIRWHFSLYYLFSSVQSFTHV